MGLGLAIGMDAMRACQAYPWWRGLLLRWCSSASVPRELIAASDREENIASVARFHGLLTELFCGLWVRRRAQVGLPDSSVRLRLVLTDLLPEDPAECRKYLLWRLADALDFQPELTRLAYMVLPSPLPGHRHAILCAVSGEKVVQQYERALAECRVRYSGLTPSSILLFNLFHQDLTGPPGSPILFLAATEASSTTVMILNGCPIFWRTRRLSVLEEPVAGTLASLPSHGEARRGSRWGERLRDLSEAIAYTEDHLGVGTPARILVTGLLTEEPGLADWLAAQVNLPVEILDVSHLVRPQPRHLSGEGWNRWEVALGAAARP